MNINLAKLCSRKQWKHTKANTTPIWIALQQVQWNIPECLPFCKEHLPISSQCFHFTLLKTLEHLTSPTTLEHLSFSGIFSSCKKMGTLVWIGWIRKFPLKGIIGEYSKFYERLVNVFSIWGVVKKWLLNWIVQLLNTSSKTILRKDG